MKTIQKFLSFLFLAFLVFAGCTKFDQNKILGTWISLDKTDTLSFVDNSSFYQSNKTMRYEHYDYHLDKDSIEIRYRGTLMILVQPTKHKYYLNNLELIIDFRNKMCYGFNSEEITFEKQ